MTGYLVRAATDNDVPAIVGYEIDIAIASFAEDAITDPKLHRKRVTGALGKPGEIMLVAVAEQAPQLPVGWAWLSARTNSLTGDRYGNFRSLATSDVADRSEIGELLMAAVVEAAEHAGLTQLTGKVHASNVGMRTLYRKFGFAATHLTMERKAGPAHGGEPGG